MREAVVFATDAWVARLKDELNQSQSYQAAAKEWEGDFLFVVEPEDHRPQPIYMYMDLYHGKCRQAFILNEPHSLNPAYRVSGKLRIWRAITQQELDPIKALLTRQLSLKGNMAKVMRNVKAATELVNCTTRLTTKFPAE
jgi:putative sterol carrier protein